MQTYKTRVANALVCTALMAVSLTTVVGQKDHYRRVKLTPGQPPSVFNSKIVDWSYDNYLIRARAGQKLTVRIASADKDVSFMVIPTRDKGTKLNPQMFASEWTTEVPRTGDYMIHVGSARGNASYRIELALQ